MPYFKVASGTLDWFGEAASRKDAIVKALEDYDGEEPLQFGLIIEIIECAHAEGPVYCLTKPLLDELGIEHHFSDPEQNH